jgi:hypothetical protein
MATLNRPNRITLDAYSDPNLELVNPNGVYSSFTNNFTTPVLNAKAIQLLNANIINSTLQLNEYSLMFFYYASNTQAGMCVASNLRCIRLFPASYVPAPTQTAYVKNKYYNDVDELITDLNTAATAGGDSVTYNPRWVAGQVVFSYDDATRRISIRGNGTTYIAPAAADDPNIAIYLATAFQAPRMDTYVNGSNGYATAPLQPYRAGFSMNARLGFAMSYYATGLYWGAVNTQRGCATSIGVPLNSTSILVEADANPILLGVQNVNVYLDIVAGSGMDTENRKNLAGVIPIQFAPLNINNYDFSSLQSELMSVPSEIYGVTVLLLDDNGFPFPQPPSYNTRISIAVFY